jgi:hypothetical protein
VARWLTTIKENKAGIVALLAEAANIHALRGFVLADPLR